MITQVKSKELATILGITQRRVNQLVKEAVLEKNSAGQFDLAQSVQAYISFAVTDSDELKKEKTLHERAKRQKAEIVLAHLENRMHDAADVEEALTGMLVTFRSRILGMPSKLAPQILGMKNIGEIQSLINKEAREALTELSEYDPAMFAGSTAPIDDED